MLAHMDEYNIHPDVANIVEPYALSLSMDGFPSWADRRGLSDLILSDGFEQHTTSTEEVANYAGALSHVLLDDVACGPQRTKELLLCASLLASRAGSLNFLPSQYCDLIRGTLNGIFEHLYHNPRANNEVVILSHFLSDTTVLERWMEIFWHCNEDLLRHPTHALHTRTMLADVLAFTLRRRSRVKLEVKPEWTHTLFSNQLAVRIAESALTTGATDDPTNSDSLSGPPFTAVVNSFLRHWRHLSPSSWSTLCDHLHNSCGESGIAEEDVEHFRIGLFPGDIDGAAGIDCDGDCACMRPYALDSDRLPAGETDPPTSVHSRADWKNRLKLRRPWPKREQPDGATARENSAAAVEV